MVDLEVKCTEEKGDPLPPRNSSKVSTSIVADSKMNYTEKN